ncbi:hypothetical protein ASPWEDRAFT_61571 [Aspergillus wentii DTO 134E9]|uniref:Saposin B-type domain-containing protein n=1 Tax=Aspergillus wentii DTO 134E9 TaxID=1073089 RepID=A0A1L9RF85_ASPWE|nr:uncharacterized protein ASPWEDRAFT_61571 [Aspergillus wentii DTO 134E9]KAI9926253.1 hypothetical protein MW887_004716 [Aspergillus wentii]OJJ33582.1 hypothetical protein ASPWEDRAFT_61571 [Aspergillus wentii DTO 134E9]
MKFSLSMVVASAAVASAASVAPSPSGSPEIANLFDIPKSCLEIPQVVGDKPLKLMHYFHTQVCEKNCSATINEHNQYLETSVYPQIMQDVNQKLGVSASDQKLFNQTHTEIVAAVKKSCSSQGEKPLCNDLQGAFNWGTCAFKAYQPIIEKHIKDLSGAVKLSDEKCEKVKELDSDQAIWQKTLPGYIDNFAKQCAKEN